VHSRKVLIVDGCAALLRARRADERSPVGNRDEYVRHKWLVEGRHGEAKVQHGLGRAVRRGLEQVAIQVLLTMTVMNLKRLAAASLKTFMRMISILASYAQSTAAVPTIRRPIALGL
jgi:hypothetical protein